jgi:hypothetical protein
MCVVAVTTGVCEITVGYYVMRDDGLLCCLCV